MMWGDDLGQHDKMQPEHVSMQGMQSLNKYATTYEMKQACDNMVRWAYTKDGRLSTRSKSVAKVMN